MMRLRLKEREDQEKGLEPLFWPEHDEVSECKKEGGRYESMQKDDHSGGCCLRGRSLLYVSGFCPWTLQGWSQLQVSGLHRRGLPGNRTPYTRRKNILRL